MIMSTDRLIILITIICDLLIFPINIYSSETDEIPILCDNYGYIIKNISDSCMTYIDKKGKEYMVSTNGVIFKGGEIALKNFIYNNLQRDYECNLREIIVIFFDKNLKIKEVRMCTINAVNNHFWCEHNKDYIRAIKKTKGMWKKRLREKYYVYILSMHIH